MSKSEDAETVSVSFHHVVDWLAKIIAEDREHELLSSDIAQTVDEAVHADDETKRRLRQAVAQRMSKRAEMSPE